MKITFVSNYLNHHQIPFCEAVISKGIAEFTFIQTEKMDEQRTEMGWGINISDYPFAMCYYDDPEKAKDLIMNSDIVMFGGVDDELYIKPRLKAGKIVIRYSERIYKEGQWKFISPRGLIKKYNDHVKYKNSPVYLFCAGGYVASDYSLIHAYGNKMYKWGYYPAVKEYSIDELLDKKIADNITYILWAGRMIDWKHPEKALAVARELKEKGIPYQMIMIGDGPLRGDLEKYAKDNKLDVEFKGFLSPEEVRENMLLADIFLFTSDYKEGWGAVLNEAMNSGCAIVASSAIGAVPYLIKHNKNGFVYRNESFDELLNYTELLCSDSLLRKRLGAQAYATVYTKWNADYAASVFIRFCQEAMIGQPGFMADGPLSIAEIVSPKRGYDYVRKS